MENLVFVAVVGVLLYACARGAQAIYDRKRRRGALGFLLGFLLGPVGLIVAGATPKLDARASHRCSYCRRWIPEDSVRCPRCGKGLQVAPSGRRPTGATVKVDYDWTQHVGRSSVEIEADVPPPEPAPRYHRG